MDVSYITYVIYIWRVSVKLIYCIKLVYWHKISFAYLSRMFPVDVFDEPYIRWPLHDERFVVWSCLGDNKSSEYEEHVHILLDCLR